MKLIKINTDHYIVVDDSEIKEGDYYFSKISDNVFRRSNGGHWIENYDKKMYQKITHSTQPLESIVTENSFKSYNYISLQKVKELIGEVDVDKRIYDTDFRGDVNSYKQGYNQAIEDNKDKKYTEEDMRNAIKMGRDIIAFDQGMIPWYKFKFVDIIQSLQPKTEWEVEIVDGKLKLK